MQLPATLTCVERLSGARTKAGRIGPADLAGVLQLIVLATPDGRRVEQVTREGLRVLYVVEGLR